MISRRPDYLLGTNSRIFAPPTPSPIDSTEYISLREHKNSVQDNVQNIDKKEKEIFLIYKQIQLGSVALQSHR
jgi:hypothetical protein